MKTKHDKYILTINKKEKGITKLYYNDSMKKEIKEKCNKCNQWTLKLAPLSFDAFSFLDSVEMVYCDNPKCEMYRVVVVVNKT